MQISCYPNKIVIGSPTCFFIRDIAESGQIFRYFPQAETDGETAYLLMSGAHFASVLQTEDRVEITCDDSQYFYRFFDLDTDYGSKRERLSSAHPVLKNACADSGGIRILQGDTAEIIFSFIVSANNNIKRIQGILERLCQDLGEETLCGKRAFPTAAALAQNDAQYFYERGAGYRAPYLAATARILSDGTFCRSLGTLDTAAAKKQLLTLPGVGPKVADCILLFGLGRLEACPADVWMQRIYREDFGGASQDPRAVSQYFSELFGTDAGLAQQYLFYSKRKTARLPKH